MGYSMALFMGAGKRSSRYNLRLAIEITCRWHPVPIRSLELHNSSPCSRPYLDVSSHSPALQLFPRNASRSIISPWNLTRKTVFPGHISPSATVCAVTRAGKSAPSHTPSMMPATKAAQLSWLISRGTLMYWLTRGSLSIIMYSSGVSGLADFSRRSACRPNRCCHTLCLIKCSRVMMFVGRCCERGGSR